MRCLANLASATYRFLSVGIRSCIKFNRGLHLKFVAYSDLTILTSLGSCVNFFASTHPQHLELDLIWGIADEKFADCQLKLELDQLHVWVA